jgi:hypothetical protein
MDAVRFGAPSDQMPVLPKDVLRLQPSRVMQRFENEGEQAFRFCGLP